MPGERPALTAAQEVLARALADAIIEDILGEKAETPDAIGEGHTTESQCEHAEAAMAANARA